MDDYQRRRWMRPNAHLWMREDAHRFKRPDGSGYVPPADGFYRRGPRDLKYDPDQPRAPAGSPDGGQWTRSESVALRDIEPDDSEAAVTTESTFTDDSRLVRVAARRSQAYCDKLYQSDIFQCKLVKSPACYAQALVRRFACENGRQIPPLNY